MRSHVYCIHSNFQDHLYTMFCIKVMSIYTCLSFFLFQLAFAVPQFDQIFEVAFGNVLGFCDPCRSILGTMFQEMLEVNANAVKQLETDQYNANAETRKLLKSMFGINPGSDGKVPKGGISLSKLAKVRSRTQRPIEGNELYTDRSGSRLV